MSEELRFLIDLHKLTKRASGLVHKHPIGTVYQKMAYAMETHLLNACGSVPTMLRVERMNKK